MRCIGQRKAIDNPSNQSDDYLQPGIGCRFTQDSIQLAHFAPKKIFGLAADLGAGTGIVGLEALYSGRLNKISTLYFVEIHKELFGPSLEHNLQTHRNKAGGPGLISVYCDWRDLSPTNFGGPLDYLISNPPYFPANGRRGKIPRALTRQETHGTISDLLKIARKLLKPEGRMALSWPKKRLPTLLEALSDALMDLCRLHNPSPGLILVEIKPR